MLDTHKYHSVKAGETLSGIAKKYHLTIEQLYKLNPHLPKNAHKLQIEAKIDLVGKKLRVSDGVLSISKMVCVPDATYVCPHLGMLLKKVGSFEKVKIKVKNSLAGNERIVAKKYVDVKHSFNLILPAIPIDATFVARKNIHTGFICSKREGDSDTDNWLKNTGTALSLTAQWALWLGEKNRTFDNDRVANSLRNSRIAEEARTYWYNSVNLGQKTIYSGLTNFKGKTRLGGGNFGLTGLISAGIDPIEQFVGSTHNYDIKSDGKILTHTITNKTHLKSLLYGVTPEFLNFYVTTQVFIFKEDICFSRIKNVDKTIKWMSCK